MGAAERRRWSSFIRQDLVEVVADQLADRQSHGVVVIGPRGVGKTTLARSVEARIAGTSYVVKLFGSGTEMAIPYGLWGVQLARLERSSLQTPNSIIQGITELVLADAHGRTIVVLLDDLQTMDTLSMGVLMHLVFSGVAKVMVLARATNDLPEDLMWLLKDGLLSELVLAAFTKSEVHALITRALGGSVAAATVAALHESSGGNPLVLHTLIHEEINRGHLVQHHDTWVLTSERTTAPSSLLAELVAARLERESAHVRHGVEMMSLVQRVPLSMVLEVLGTETVSEMEERNYLDISEKAGRYTALAEPFMAETVRATLGREEKALLYRELTQAVSLDAHAFSRHEFLVFAAWAHDAGIPLEPEVALSAARAALVYSEPQLVLTFAAAAEGDATATVFAALVRSAAYLLLAEYPRAVAEILQSKEQADAALGVVDHAIWVGELCGALLWVDGGAAQIPGLLRAESAKLNEAGHDPEQVANARRSLNLVKFEYQVHSGLFSETALELEAGYREMVDTDYSLFCGSLLVVVWAATGRELDAVELAQEIAAQFTGSSRFIRQPDLHLHGLVLALTWSGQWRAGTEILTQMLGTMRRRSEYHGGIIELGLGIAHLCAGKGLEAADILLAAVAQLEIRDTYNCTQLAYAALGCALAQVDDDVEAAKYLALAGGLAPNTAWVNLSMTKLFTLLAQRWMGDPNATEALVASAQEDIAAGRYTLAAQSLFGASVSLREKDLQLLESTAAMGQGPLAELSLLLAQASLGKDAEKALTAAAMAEDMDLAAVELRCALLALDLARSAGFTRQAKEAEARVDHLTPSSPALPLVPATEGVKLTQRELQVAKLAGRGMANRAIAERMGVSIRTVEGHLYQVFSKLGLSSRNELF
ncbi:helix-turn-helix transcriptional regulator [Arthrobacter sp. TMN-49]